MDANRSAEHLPPDHSISNRVRARNTILTSNAILFNDILLYIMN
jgi:hypothetical protein